jgi:hypothetical protein
MMNSLNRDQRQKLIDAIKERAKKMMTDTITNLTPTIPPSLSSSIAWPRCRLLTATNLWLPL